MWGRKLFAAETDQEPINRKANVGQRRHTDGEWIENVHAVSELKRQLLGHCNGKKDPSLGACAGDGLFFYQCKNGGYREEHYKTLFNKRGKVNMVAVTRHDLCCVVT